MTAQYTISSRHASWLHMHTLAAFRVAARPFIGTRLGSRIARAIPGTRAMYYAVYSHISRTLVDVETPFGVLTADLRDRSVAQKLFISRRYEQEETAILQRLVEPGMTFFDVGAHIGYFTLIASRKVGDAGRVVSFEPDPANAALLSKNVESNALANVEVVTAAVGAMEGAITLFRNEHYTGDNRTHATADPRPGVVVPLVQLDTVCAARAVTPDVIKMDVQGAEADVVDGMQRLLHESPPRVIMSEFWPAELMAQQRDPARLLDGLIACGYRAFEVGRCDPAPVSDGGRLVASLPGAEDYTNVLFVRADAIPQWLS